MLLTAEQAPQTSFWLYLRSVELKCQTYFLPITIICNLGNVFSVFPFVHFAIWWNLNRWVSEKASTRRDVNKLVISEPVSRIHLAPLRISFFNEIKLLSNERDSWWHATWWVQHTNISLILWSLISSHISVKHDLIKMLSPYIVEHFTFLWVQLFLCLSSKFKCLLFIYNKDISAKSIEIKALSDLTVQ